MFQMRLEIWFPFKRDSQTIEYWFQILKLEIAKFQFKTTGNWNWNVNQKSKLLPTTFRFPAKKGKGMSELKRKFKFAFPKRWIGNRKTKIDNELNIEMMKLRAGPPGRACATYFLILGPVSRKSRKLFRRGKLLYVRDVSIKVSNCVGFKSWAIKF